jgi:NUMOD3 motif
MIRSLESRLRMSAAKLGKRLTAAHRAAIAKGMTGKKLSADHKRKMADARRGRRLSAETRERISVSVKAALRAKWEAVA